MWNFWIVFSLGPKKNFFFRSNSVALQRISGNEFSIFNLGHSTLPGKRTPGFYITLQNAPWHKLNGINSLIASRGRGDIFRHKGYPAPSLIVCPL